MNIHYLYKKINDFFNSPIYRRVLRNLNIIGLSLIGVFIITLISTLYVLPPVVSFLLLLVLFLCIISINFLEWYLVILVNLFFGVILISFIHILGDIGLILFNKDVALNIIRIYLAGLIINTLIANYKVFSLKSPTHNTNKFLVLLFRSRLLYPILSYFIIVLTVIYSFSIYYNFYNDVYNNLSFIEGNRFEGRTSDLDNSIFIDVFRVADDNSWKQQQYLRVYRNDIGVLNPIIRRLEKNKIKIDLVQIQITYKHSDIIPDYILLSFYDQSGTHIHSELIDRAINYPAGRIESSLYKDELSYFSYVTFFTVGYGDYIPNAEFIKELVEMEMLISHIISTLYLPILIIFSQKIFETINYSRNEKVMKDKLYMPE